MNEEQIKTQELIFRNQEDRTETKKSRKGAFSKVIAGVAAVVLLAAVIAGAAVVRSNFTVKGNGGAQDVTGEPSQTADEGRTGDTEDASMQGDGQENNGSGELATNNDTEKRNKKPDLSINKVATLDWDDLKGDVETITDDEFWFADDELISSGETIGLLGTGADILDFYRADDPALPSYLTRSYNAKFVMDLSTEEIELLMHLVEAEAPSEDIFGKILVANVVLNRVVMGGWGKGVTGVIYKKFGTSVQFASTVQKAYWNSIKVTDSTREAVMRALAGEDYSNGALFFFAWKKHPELTQTTGWTKNYKYLFKHGGHAFYR